MNIQKLYRPDGTYLKIESNLENSNVIGICFSGLHYSYSSPLLYYSRNSLFEFKIDYLAIDYMYLENDLFTQMDDKKQHEYIENDKKIVTEYLLKNTKQYEKMILIGKSIGVHFIRTLMKNQTIKEKAILILFTPAYEWNEIIIEIVEDKYPVLIIGSKKDKLFNVSNLAKLSNRTNCEVLEISNADHSLEVDNITNDLANLTKIIECVKEFIKFKV
jgi:hypothetical protein